MNRAAMVRLPLCAPAPKAPKKLKTYSGLRVIEYGPRETISAFLRPHAALPAAFLAVAG